MAKNQQNVVIAATDVSDAKVEKVVDIIEGKKDKTPSKKTPKPIEDKAPATNKPKESEVTREVWAKEPKKTNKERKVADLQPLMGEVVVIMGVPKADNQNARNLIPAIGETVRNAYEYLDVIKIKDVNLNAPFIFADKEGDRDTRDYVHSGEGRATMALIMHEYNRDKGRPDLATTGNRNRDYLSKVVHDSNNAEDKRNGEAVVNAFDIAQRWVGLPDLTPRERVHGAVHDLYSRYGYPQHGEGDQVVQPSQEYAQHYESHFAEDIKFRTIRAAKDLFGSKK